LPASDSPLAYRRILLKLSGESLMGDRTHGIDPAVVGRILDEIRATTSLGVQLGIVIGGGNIFRGVAGAAQGMDRGGADDMGMLATVINALALQDAFEHGGLETVVQSALRIERMAEPFDRRRARAHLAAGRLVIFAAGTGNPFFTTDTAASLRALEVGADVMLKATKVDGVYDKDPVKHADAVRYNEVSYDEALAKRLGVMDATAIALCRDHNLPVRVFSITKPGSLRRIVTGENEGTLVRK